MTETQDINFIIRIIEDIFEPSNDVDITPDKIKSIRQKAVKRWNEQAIPVKNTFDPEKMYYPKKPIENKHKATVYPTTFIMHFIENNIQKLRKITKSNKTAKQISTALHQRFDFDYEDDLTAMQLFRQQTDDYFTETESNLQAQINTLNVIIYAIKRQNKLDINQEKIYQDTRNGVFRDKDLDGLDLEEYIKPIEPLVEQTKKN